jgi:hypothetical protein
MKHTIGVVTALALAMVLTGCATSPVQRTEKLLTQSGFKPVVASTAGQQQRLQSLPLDRVSVAKRQGKTYYVYPDPARNVLYVGKQAQYQAYQTAVQDRYLTQDARLSARVAEAPVFTQDSLEMGGGGPDWVELWQGWPD